MDWSWIEPGRLAAGSIPRTAHDLRLLHAAGIRALLTLTVRPLSLPAVDTPALLAELEIQPAHIPIVNNEPPTLEQARQIAAIIEEASAAGRALYLHCHRGRGRTGTVLHLYYLSQGLSFSETYARLRATRPVAVRLRAQQHAFLYDFVAQRRGK